MAKTQELRNQSVEELKALYQDLSRELFSLSNEVQLSRKIEKPHRRKLARKNRARVLTVLREKQTPVVG